MLEKTIRFEGESFSRVRLLTRLKISCYNLHKLRFLELLVTYEKSEEVNPLEWFSLECQPLKLKGGFLHKMYCGSEQIVILLI